MEQETTKLELIEWIVTIDNKETLEFLKSIKDSHNGNLFQKLSQQQKEELLLSDEESKNADNLLNNEELKEKQKKWLSK